MPLEVLDRPLVLFRRSARLEGAEVSALTCPRIGFPGIQTVAAAPELTNHGASAKKSLRQLTAFDAPAWPRSAVGKGLSTSWDIIGYTCYEVTNPFFTIGHSTRALEELVGLLEGAEVKLLADVRTIPRSRTNPQFNKDVLPGALAPFGIAYEQMPPLGGLRGKARTTAPDVNAFWTNESFHNFADYALSEQFRAGLEHLLDAGHGQRCAIMCSEAVWWRCHRRIVADYLIARHESVFHIMGPGRLEPARLTPGAVIRPDGTVVYPPGADG